VLVSTCNPQLSVDLNWTGVSRLFFLFSWVPQYLRPSMNDHTDLYRDHMRCIITVDWNRVLISASFQIYPSSHATTTSSLCDSFVNNKSYRVSLLVLTLTSHLRISYTHSQPSPTKMIRRSTRRQEVIYDVLNIIRYLTFAVLWF